MRQTTPLIPWLLVLASCSSPPIPPTVDESQKRPVNSQMAVELQVCKNDLQNTRLLATESGRTAETTGATLANLAARQKILAAMQGTPGQQPKGNSVFTVRFDFGSTRVAIPTDVAATLVEDAKASPLVMLRGRTDGTSDAPAESRIARDRAAAVRDYLVAAGVDPARIRATYQPAGDQVADNASASGRGLNRRVEIELYRALPVAVSSTPTALP
ncbi:OmpA family protein [Ideonella sp.]|uniref:OmpA family protein n=1 Tax=Ideonella sp. TaxID=1929293 RepID=UPI003BB58FF6